MKKIPTLFKRVFDEKGNKIDITDELTSPDLRCVLSGKCIATEKFDGSCCAIIKGKFYKRFDAKKGRMIPEGAIPCQDKPDEVTGHFPHWVECNRHNNADKWFWEAYDATRKSDIHDGTYEAIGLHFNGNPYNMKYDILVPHGEVRLNVPTDLDGIAEYLANHYIEGIVWWRFNRPIAKIKRTDFGLDWGDR